VNVGLFEDGRPGGTRPVPEEIHPEPTVGSAQVLEDVAAVTVQRGSDRCHRFRQPRLPIIAGEQRPEIDPGRAAAGPRHLGRCHTDTASVVCDPA